MLQHLPYIWNTKTQILVRVSLQFHKHFFLCQQQLKHAHVPKEISLLMLHMTLSDLICPWKAHTRVCQRFCMQNTWDDASWSVRCFKEFQKLFFSGSGVSRYHAVDFCWRRKCVPTIMVMVWRMILFWDRIMFLDTIMGRHLM